MAIAVAIFGLHSPQALAWGGDLWWETLLLIAALPVARLIEKKYFPPPTLPSLRPAHP